MPLLVKRSLAAPIPPILLRSSSRPIYGTVATLERLISRNKGITKLLKGDNIRI